MRNPIAGLFLLTCLIAPCLLTLGRLQHEKYLIKKAVKKQILAGIDHSELILLKFSKQEAKTSLDWEHEAEFEFRGKMFDVVEIMEEGDSVTYRCRHDEIETGINQTLAHIVNGLWVNHPAKKQSEQRLFDFFKTFFCIENGVKRFQPTEFQLILPAWIFCFTLPKSEIKPPSQPPELA